MSQKPITTEEFNEKALNSNLRAVMHSGASATCAGISYISWAIAKSGDGSFIMPGIIFAVAAAGTTIRACQHWSDRTAYRTAALISSQNDSKSSLQNTNTPSSL